MISFPKNLDSVKQSYSLINSLSNFFQEEAKKAPKPHSSSKKEKKH